MVMLINLSLAGSWPQLSDGTPFEWDNPIITLWLKNSSFQIKINLTPWFTRHLGLVHTTPFLLLFVFVVSTLYVHTIPFLYKNEEKYLRFCLFTLEQNALRNFRFSAFTSLVFVHCCCIVFKNIRFCAFTLFFSVFEKLRFCRYPLWRPFSKTSVFVSFLFVSMWTLLQKQRFFFSFLYKNGIVWTGPYYLFGTKTQFRIGKNQIYPHQ